MVTEWRRPGLRSFPASRNDGDGCLAVLSQRADTRPSARGRRRERGDRHDPPSRSARRSLCRRPAGRTKCGVPRAAPSSTLTSPNGGRSATYAICDRFSSCLASEMRSPFSSRLGCASNALATGSSSILLLLYSLKVSIAGSVGRLGVVSRTNGARVSFFPRGRPRRGAQHVRRCPAPAEKSSMHGSGCRVAKESDVVFAPQRKGHFFCQALGDSEAWDDNLAVVLLDSHIIAESPGETIAVLPSSRPRPRPADRCKTSTCKCTFSRSPECVAQARGRRSLSVPMPP